MHELTERVFKIAPPGGMFDTTVVRNLFSTESEGSRKLLVFRAVHAGEVIRLKPGAYLLAPTYRKSEVHPYVIAAFLHAPSHVSLQSALAHHGLIPEAVYQVSSVTAARSRTYSTPVGTFSFERVPAIAPRAGVVATKLGKNAWAFIATALRAIADLVYLDRRVSWATDGARFLTESLRIDDDDLRGLPWASLTEICASIRDRRTREYLTALEREYHHA
jgi:predicted transcriptional regulator of viral defense system